MELITREDWARQTTQTRERLAALPTAAHPSAKKLRDKLETLEIIGKAEGWSQSTFYAGYVTAYGELTAGASNPAMDKIIRKNAAWFDEYQSDESVRQVRDSLIAEMQDLISSDREAAAFSIAWHAMLAMITKTGQGAA